ncbi:MAG: FmdB family zinc ribbon protein [Candidatus Omnitrophota bacterium]
MPTYEYECEKCGNAFEKFQKMTDDPLKKCPECGGKVVRLIGSGSGIIFKGSGFYETDYKKKRGSAGKDAPPCPGSGDCKSCPSGKKKNG